MNSDLRLGGDLCIKRLGFGAMRLPTSGFHGPPRDPETGRAVLRRAVELGVNHIDTAAFYRSSDGAVRANTLATKVGPVVGPPITLAIPGTGSLPHLEENMSASSIALTADDLAELASKAPSKN